MPAGIGWPAADAQTGSIHNSAAANAIPSIASGAGRNLAEGIRSKIISIP
jgi:hypothetical protein